MPNSRRLVRDGYLPEPTGWNRVRWDVALALGWLFWHALPPYRIGRRNLLHTLTSRLTDAILP